MKPFFEVGLLAPRREATDVLLRAFAISFVVLNHASALPGRWLEPGGGLNVLVLLSGIMFAHYTLSKDTAQEMRHATLSFGLKIALPSLAIILLSFAVLGEFSWRELFFINHLFATENISLMYSWYPEALLQILSIFLLATLIPGVVPFIRTHPIAAAVWAVGLSFVAYLILRAVWYPPHMDVGNAGRMFYFVMWQFALGWLIGFAVSGPHPVRLAGRIAIFVLGLALIALSFEPRADFSRIIVMSGALGALLFVPTTTVPMIVARICVLISQATFTIFLLHKIFLKAYVDLGLRVYTEQFVLWDTLLAWTFAVAGCFTVWLAMTAIRRAWRRSVADARVQLQGQRHPAARAHPGAMSGVSPA